MSVSLIVFRDKAHIDLHGSLSFTPIICTLSCFNSRARNNNKFWRPMAYIPNLSYGNGKSDKMQSSVKVQDKKKCIALAFQLLRDCHRSGQGLKM